MRNNELEPFGEVTDPRERARLLDHGLDALARGTGPGEFAIGMPGPEALDELAAKIREARPDGGPFDLITELPRTPTSGRDRRRPGDEPLIPSI